MESSEEVRGAAERRLCIESETQGAHAGSEEPYVLYSVQFEGIL